jgi:hypothetical protein
MADNASRRGAANLGMPLMIVAFIVIGGFLYWLNLQAEAERASDLAEEAAVEEATEGLAGGTLVNAQDIQMDPSPFEGQEIRLEGMPVASGLGTQGFWIEMPNRNPFLVSMSEGVKAEGLAIVPGQEATVVGTIYAMSDSALSAWTAAGAVGEGDRLAAEFATHYLEATGVVFSEGAGDGS